MEKGEFISTDVKTGHNGSQEKNKRQEKNKKTRI
jgi:hypothetical protein